MADVIGGKVVRLGWAATCMDCDRALAPGDRAWWFHLEDVGRCMTCAEVPIPVAPVTATAIPVEQPAPPATAPPAPPVMPSADLTPPREDLAPQPQPPTSAGASAQNEYERRRGLDGARARRSLPRLLLFVAAAPVVGYFGVRVGADILDGQFRSVTSSAEEGGVETGPMFDSGLIHQVGLVAAFALFLMTVSAARTTMGARQSTEAWRIGAEGERLTGQVLLELPSTYRVQHDLAMPGSKANIDHVVTGPTGVFTVETKNYKDGVTITNGRVFGAGRSLDHVVQQARRQAAVVAEKTGTPVMPIVCVHGGGVKVKGRLQQPIVDGVRFCSGRQLIETIASYPVKLSDVAIEDIERRMT